MIWSEEAVRAEVQYRRMRASRAPVRIGSWQARGLWHAVRAAQWPGRLVAGRGHRRRPV